MARPVSIQADMILEAARKVFMKEGFKASTARIAREAGVSEGSLFKHFKSKVNLFLTAMQIKAGAQSWEDQLMASAGHGDIRAALEAAGTDLLENLRLVLPRMMMVSSSGVTIPKHHGPGQQPPPLQKMDVICNYFKEEIKAGRLTMTSPQIQAHAFMGALSHYAWCETLFGYRSAPPEVFVRSVVDTILRASLNPSGKKPQERERRPRR